MRATLTPAEALLLGLLAERPRHGYELEEVIAARGMREWTEIGFSSIYYLIGRLEKYGFVTEVPHAPGPKPGRGKPRKVYAPAPAGLAALAEATRTALAEPHPLFPQLLVGLANQPVLDSAEVAEALDRRAALLAERAAAVRAAVQPGAPAFVQAIFDYSLSQLDAERRWLDTYRATLRAEPGANPMSPYDVKRDQKALYAPKNTDWGLVEVPVTQYIAVDGSGDPNTAGEYRHAVEALYAVAYAIKFASRSDLGRDLVAGPLEGLWWADDMSVFTSRAKGSWKWTMLIHQPGWITEEMIEAAKATAAAKKKLPSIGLVHRRELTEGTCAQVLHIGSYDDEAPLLERLHQDYLPAHGLVPAGLHHEIYLSDPRRVEPAKMKTIVRQPVAPQ
ncbi:GyrI-like domain-containing protein [Longispora albida]|uniref:GyrI-like domain-containing protein n=1 Tax=Longispora albida TaxID=203523 RepID=UPI000377B9AF|nr:GyrI-like domain-containing protein [Longispora albida]